MSKQLKLSDYDFVFLSYDEPNADENYENLQKQIPWSKRVHGVKGSDAAHKACAELAETDRLVIIDGDNWVYDGLLNEIITVENTVDLSSTVFSFPGKNVINGLVYGNGGIKFWPKDAIMNMKTHEAADLSDTKSQVDFCWAMNYVRIDRCFSEVRNNASAFQAWRAGFREGVKMSLVDGSKVTDVDDIWPGNLKNLLVWMSVGLDVKHGVWALLGARQGCYLTNFTDWDHVQVRDFDYLKQYWVDNVQGLSQFEALKSCKQLEDLLKEKFNVVRPLNQDQSHFLKKFILVHRNEHTPSEYYSLNHEQFRIDVKESRMFL